MLLLAFILTVYSVINCFQFAAGILANQMGLSFWRWFWISLFLPWISLIILVFIWDPERSKETVTLSDNI